MKNIKEFCQSNNSFLFACVLISTIFWLKHFFHLDFDRLSLFKGVNAERVSRKGLKYFLSFAHKFNINTYNEEKITENKSSKEYILLTDHKKKNPSQIIQFGNNDSIKIDQAMECALISDCLFDNTSA